MVVPTQTAPRAPAAESAAPRVKSRERQLTFFEYAHALTERARRLDPAGPAASLFAITLALSAIGLVVQASHAATTLTAAEFGPELAGQALFRAAGLAVMLFAARIGPGGIRRALPTLWIAMVVLLVGVFFPPFGKALNGSHRWIDLGFVRFQPSELTRLVIVMFIADRCVKLGEKVRDIRHGVMPTLAFGLLPVGLVMIETDIGGASLMMLAVVATIWVGGAQPRHVFTPMLVAAPLVAVIAYTRIDYIRRRIEMFLGSTRNQQVIDSFAAIAGGDFWGVGLAQGMARNQGVPYLESDFVFAQIGEELGLFGMLLVIVLWGGFLWSGLRLVLAIRDRYDALASFGLLFSTLSQALLHIGVVAGLAPPKGMTLPFISHGGTSLIVSSLAVGLALGAARRTRQSQSATQLAPAAAGPAQLVPNPSATSPQAPLPTPLAL